MNINDDSKHGIIDNHKPSLSVTKKLRLIITGILFFVFMMGISWLTGQITTLVNEPSKLALATYFSSLDESSRVLQIDKVKTIFPASFFIVIAIFIHIIVIFITSSLLKALLKCIWNLQSTNASAYTKKIHSKIDDIKSKFNEYIAELKKAGASHTHKTKNETNQ